MKICSKSIDFQDCWTKKKPKKPNEQKPAQACSEIIGYLCFLKLDTTNSVIAGWGIEHFTDRALPQNEILRLL